MLSISAAARLRSERRALRRDELAANSRAELHGRSMAKFVTPRPNAVLESMATSWRGESRMAALAVIEIVEPYECVSSDERRCQIICWRANAVDCFGD